MNKAQGTLIAGVAVLLAGCGAQAANNQPELSFSCGTASLSQNAPVDVGITAPTQVYVKSVLLEWETGGPPGSSTQTVKVNQNIDPGQTIDVLVPRAYGPAPQRYAYQCAIDSYVLGPSS